jgi:hypothetical protein
MNADIAIKSLTCGCVPGELLCNQAADLWKRYHHYYNLEIQGAATQTEVEQARQAYNRHFVEREKSKQVSFVFVIESINETSADELLDDLVDFIMAHGHPEMPMMMPGDILTQIGVGHGEA